MCFFATLATTGATSGCSGVSFPANGNWPAASTPDYAHQARFAVTVNLADQLAFVSADAHDPKVLGDAAVGDVPVELEGPHHLAADSQFIYYNLSNYVPGTGSGPHGSHGLGTVPGSLVKLDAQTNERVGEVLVDRSPGDVILSSDGKLAYVTHYDLLKVQAQLSKGGPVEDAYSTIAIVDTTGTMNRLSLTPVCPTAHGEGLSADGKTLYVSCAQSDELAIVDVTDPVKPVVQRRLPVGPTPGKLGMPSYGPYALVVSPADGTVWISDNNSGDVRVYDPAKQAMDDTRTVGVGGVAMFASFTSDGKHLFVPHQGDDQVTRIEVATLATTNVPLPPNGCRNAHAFVIAPDGINAVVVCEGDHVKIPGTIVYFTTTPFALTNSVEVGMFPDGAAWLPPAP
jgi:DNA-binding beta-propeller fold protein YncE